MKLFYAIIHIGLLRAALLAHDLHNSTIENKLTIFVSESLNNSGGTTGGLFYIPIEDDFGVGLIYMLTSGPGAPGEGKSQFRKRYFNLIHSCYHYNMKGNPWFVYIIENEKGYLYTGITTDPVRRFKEHSSSKKGAKFFKTGAPVKMVFKKKFPDRSLASKFECFVKKLTRKQKIELISTKRKYA